MTLAEKLSVIRESAEIALANPRTTNADGELIAQKHLRRLLDALDSVEVLSDEDASYIESVLQDTANHFKRNPTEWRADAMVQGVHHRFRRSQGREP